MIYRPHGHLLAPKGCFLLNMAIFSLWARSRVRRTLPILILMSLVFLLGWLEHILTMARLKFTFLIFCIFHRLYRGSKGYKSSRWGLKTPFKKNFIVIYFHFRSGGTHLDHGQNKIKKLSPDTPHPNVQSNPISCTQN